MMLLATAITLTLLSGSLPKDTLRIGEVRIPCVAVRRDVVSQAGDLNLDGSVSTADIIQLVRHVLLNQPLPERDTLAFEVEVLRGADTATYLVIPTTGGSR
jgi:hypothetical protein